MADRIGAIQLKNLIYTVSMLQISLQLQLWSREQRNLNVIKKILVSDSESAFRSYPKTDTFSSYSILLLTNVIIAFFFSAIIFVHM